MRQKFILLAFLSVILFTSCMSESERRHYERLNVEMNSRDRITAEQDLNSLKRPIVLIAKSKTSLINSANDYYSIVVRTGNDSLVSYSGRESEMINTIGESFNINDTIN